MIFLLVHLICCAFMTGLIWTIQVLHYPAFASVREDQFSRFHIDHSRKITFIVVPVMLIEFVTAVALLYKFPGNSILWINGAFLILTWGFTFFLSVPLHGILSKNQEMKAINSLVNTNWPRTFLWSVRVFMLLYFILQIKGAGNGHLDN